jgi:two-component system, chemotaxis family, chemotaxis protein CheY
MKYLIVDDSPTMRRIVINSLAILGFSKIEEAGDGFEALKKLEVGNIDFVITDWNMPNMSGLDLIKTIRSSERFKDLPILMVTTRGNKEDIIDALKARADNYVVKPFTAQVMKEKIDAILRKRGLV